MSAPINARASRDQLRARVFRALADETRLALVGRLASGQRYSIAQLTQDTALTRQAVTKHLRVLERVRLVHSTRTGRESLFELDPRPIADMKDYLDLVSRRWDSALNRLKAFVESDVGG